AGKKTVVSITDNACFLTNGMEISTAVNYDIPVIWIIQNNVKSSLIDPTRQKSLSHQSQFSGICSEINFCKIAEGLGAAGYQISKPGELKQILPEAISLNKPVVIDCLIDPDEFSFYKNKDASQK
ncbi:hypothetical protein KA977_13265, partial [Candidatus Dependentiae bacterium]|nr:hypothetical protein [Candidatus Dependentiae bacterium]